jgi:Xaa-Pro aminopeptidase
MPDGAAPLNDDLVLCNRERAVAVMDKFGLDGLVAAEARNVYYLSNFTSNIMWNWTWTSFAILPRDPAVPPTLLCSNLDLPVLIANPTWMPNVVGFALFMGGADAPQKRSFKPTQAPGSTLRPYERKAMDLYEATPAIIAKTSESLVAEALKDLKLDDKKLGFDDVRLAQRVGARHLPKMTTADARDMFREIRMVKTPHEIKLMRHSARINEQAQMAAIKATKVGATWDDLLKVYNIEMIKLGGKPVYMIRGAGELSGVRVQITDYPIKPGDFVFYDSLGEYKHYKADIGRTSVLGAAPPEYRKTYDAMRKGWEEGCARVRPGMMSTELAEIITTACQKAGYPDYMSKAAGPHSLGLEHFDHPQYDGFYQPFVIEENCVLNVDMPLLIYGRDAMHLEDTIIVRKDGIEYLTSNQTGMVEIPI